MATAVTVHRHVRTIYAVRVVSFIWCFLVLGLHIWERGFGAPYWAALVFHFLIYPHLAYRRSAWSKEQWPAEVQNLYADAALCGIWVSALEFPLWIAFPLTFAPALNAIVNRGPMGLAISLACSSLGVLAGVLLHGYVYWTQTSALVTTLCFLGSLAYAAGVGNIVFHQARHMAAARATLRESEYRYRLIAEHAGDLVAMVDRDGRWLYASPSYGSILAEEQLETGRDAFSSVHEEDQFRVRGALQVVVRSGESCRLRLRLHTRDRDVRRFEAMMHAVEEDDAQGGGRKISGAVIAARDVTELRDREEQLEVAAHAFERMAEAMVITNAAGRILMVNQAYTRITGYTQDEVVGRHENEFRAAMQPPSFYDELYAEVLRSGHWDGTSWCRRRDGNVYREWRSVSAVRDADEHVSHFVALFHEVNDRGAGQAPQDRAAKSA